MKFKTYRIADIFTGYITQRDGQLLSRYDAPYHMARIDPDMLGKTDRDSISNEDNTPGDFFWVPNELEKKEAIKEFREFGFSEAFIKIIRALIKQKIPYVRFDRDGAEVEGAREFEW